MVLQEPHPAVPVPVRTQRTVPVPVVGFCGVPGVSGDLGLVLPKALPSPQNSHLHIVWHLSQNCGCVSLHSRLNSVKESSRFRVSSGRTLQFGPQSGLDANFLWLNDLGARSLLPATRLLSLPLGAEGGWRQGSGGRDGVGPSRFRLVMLTPSRCLLVVVTITPSCEKGTCHRRCSAAWASNSPIFVTHSPSRQLSIRRRQTA